MENPGSRRRFGFAYDSATGGIVIAVAIAAAVFLGFLAFNYQGSPRMDDKAKVQQGATIPNPTELSPAETTGAQSTGRQ